MLSGQSATPEAVTGPRGERKGGVWILNLGGALPIAEKRGKKKKKKKKKEVHRKLQNQEKTAFCLVSNAFAEEETRTSTLAPRPSSPHPTNWSRSRSSPNAGVRRFAGERGPDATGHRR